MLRFFWRLFTASQRSGASSANALPCAQPSSAISVFYDEQGVQLHCEGEAKQSVAWGDIDLIAIRIEDDFLPFPYWYVGNQENLLRIPNDAIGGQKLFFDGFGEHLPGYPSDAALSTIMEASAAMAGSFVVWRAEHATAD